METHVSVGPYSACIEQDRDEYGPIYKTEQTEQPGPHRSLRVRLFTPVTQGNLSPQIGQLAARLRRITLPNLPDLIVAQQLESGLFMLVVEQPKGAPLFTWLEGASPGSVLDVLWQAGAVLASAHAAGLLHGCLRAESLWVDSAIPDKPLLLLLDLGIVGTPGLAARVAGQDAGPALGAESSASGPAGVESPSAALDCLLFGQVLKGVLSRIRHRADLRWQAQEAALDALTELAEKLTQEASASRPASSDAAAVLRRLADGAANPSLRATQPNLVALPPPSVPPGGPRAAVEASRPAGSSEPEPRAGSTGQKIKMYGNFSVLQLLGRGGMGAVYEAINESIARRAAIKIMHPAFAANTEYAARFLREAKTACAVSHPGLVEVYDFGSTTDGTLYIIMELLKGETLQQLLSRSPAGLPQKTALLLARDLTQAIAAAHAAGIVHRDLKPDNIMLLKSAADAPLRPKILDFGIAKLRSDSSALSPDLTGINRRLGTDLYMAPEQFDRAREATDRADIFALAVVLCELLSGERPFPGNSLILACPGEHPAPRLPARLPRELRELLADMLAPEPGRRPPASQVAARLEDAVGIRAPRRYAPVLAAVLIGASIGAAGMVAKLRRPPAASFDTRAYEAVYNESGRVLERYTRSPDSALRRGSVEDLGTLKLGSLKSMLTPLLSAEDPGTVTAAIWAAGEVRLESSKPALLRLWEAHPLEQIGIEAAAALGKLGDARGPEHLLALLRSGSGSIRVLSAERLCEQENSEGCAALAGFADQPELSADVRQRMLGVLKKNQDATDVGSALHKQMQDALQRGDWTICYGAAALLTHWRGEQSHADDAIRTLKRGIRAHNFAAALMGARVYVYESLDVLLPRLLDASEPPRNRKLAALAIAHINSPADSVPALASLLTDPSVPDLVRQGTAASVRHLLQIKFEPQSLEQVATLTSPIGIVDNITKGKNIEQATLAFGQLKGSDKRLLVLTELGERRAERALSLAAKALEDADHAVKVQGMRAIEKLAAARSGLGGGESLLREHVQRLVQSNDPSERIVAEALLLRLDPSRSAVGANELFETSKNAAERELFIELMPPDRIVPLLRKATSDPSLSVRYLAARSLLGRGDRAGLPVLQQMLDSRSGYALVAYEVLSEHGAVRKGDLPEVDWAALLSRERVLWVRYEGAHRLRYLPVEEALPLLTLSMSDPAAVVRRAAADSAAVLYRQGKQAELLRIILAAAADEDPIVRRKGCELLCSFEQRTYCFDAADVHVPAVQHGRSAASTPEQPSVPEQKVPDAAATRPGGAPDAGQPSVDAASSQVTGEKTPPAPAKERARQEATRLAARARQEDERTDAKANAVEALRLCEQYLALPEWQRTPELTAEIKRRKQALLGRTGTYQIYDWVNGACVAVGRRKRVVAGSYTETARSGQQKVVPVKGGQHELQVRFCP